MPRRIVCTMMFILLAPAIAAAQDDLLLERTKKKIEALQLQWSLDRSDAALENLLGDLADQLPGFELASRLEIAKAMSEHYRRIGKNERAEKILDGPLGHLATDEERAQWDAAVQKLMGQGKERPKPEQDEDSLRKFILGKLDGNHLDELRALGPRALPVIEQMILEDRTDMRTLVSGSQTDPLRDYILIAPERSAQFLLEQLDEQGLAFQSRVLSAAQSAKIFEQRLAWTLDQPPLCNLPTWRKVVERLTERQEAFGASALQGLVWSLMMRDALTPDLTNNLTMILKAGDPVLAGALVEMVREAPAVPTLTPILLHLIRSEQAPWREMATSKLLRMRHASGLLRFASDSNPELRQAAARVLGFRSVQSPVWGGSPPGLLQSSDVRILPKLDDEELGILLRLSRDEDVSVRATAASSLLDAAGRAPDSVYLELIEDPSPKVRGVLTRLESGVSDDTLRQIVRKLSRDPAEKVVSNFLETMQFHMGEPSDRWVSIYLEPVLFASYAVSSSLPAESDTWRLDLAGNWTRQSWNARKIATRFMVQQGRSEAMDRWFSGHGSKEIEALVPSELSADDLERCLTHSASAFTAILNGGGEEGQTAFRRILRNPELDPNLRIQAAWYLSSVTDEDLDTVFELISKSHRDASTLSAILTDAAPASRNRFVFRVLQSEALPAAALVELRWAFGAAHETEIVRFVLERWLDRPETWDGKIHSLVADAVFRVAHLEMEDRDVILRKALDTPRLREAAIRAYIDLKDNSIIPELGELATTSLEAVDALLAFGTDEAIAELMAALDKVTDRKMASRISGALNALWQQRQDRQKWETLKTPLPTKESALAELLAMLDQDDPALQIEALKGIGALGAKEAIPKLIPFLRSDNEALKQVAREVLDRLYE
ncbi:MAG: hypothetical protein RL885_20845 [Planctomycetota bacterium]